MNTTRNAANPLARPNDPLRSPRPSRSGCLSESGHRPAMPSRARPRAAFRVPPRPARAPSRRGYWVERGRFPSGSRWRTSPVHLGVSREPTEHLEWDFLAVLAWDLLPRELAGTGDPSAG